MYYDWWTQIASLYKKYWILLEIDVRNSKYSKTVNEICVTIENNSIRCYMSITSLVWTTAITINIIIHYLKTQATWLKFNENLSQITRNLYQKKYLYICIYIFFIIFSINILYYSNQSIIVYFVDLRYLWLFHYKLLKLLKF